MTSIVSSNSSTGTSAAAALIPGAGNGSTEAAAQDFQRMLRSHAAQLSMSPAPQPAPRANVQVAQPKDDISDTQREETRLSNLRKQNPAAAPKPIKNPPCETHAVASDDTAADAPDDAAQQPDASTQAAARQQSANAPAADATDAGPEAAKAAKAAKKTGDEDAAAPADATEDCRAPDARATTGDSGAAAALDPAAMLAAAQLNGQASTAALQPENGGTGKARAQATDATQARQAAGADAAADAGQARTEQAGDAASAGGSASFASLLGAAGQPAAAASIASGAVDHGASAQLAALAGLPSAAANSAGSAAAPAVSTPSSLVLAQPLQDPGFASEMSARLSVLASQGVQHAQLHLNPAEMGPVQVQIAVDGQQAQVSFHAEHAETRAVLERSLPDLAAALRDTGLTLSGGGVFQTASGGSGNSNGSFQQQARDGAASSAAGNGRIQRMTSADDALPAISRAGGVRGGPVRGVVDLYA